ncbi:MAG: hypothetical protein K0S18_458 [Anaerocolumna sp.]|nr:hypothetical protein [Anaerocolumna sp.]
MRISDLIKMGLRNLSRRKARTALTVIGVVIGTISIVVMVSIGIGMNTNFTSQVMEQGSLTTVTVERIANIMDDEGNYINSKEQDNKYIVFGSDTLLDFYNPTSRNYTTKSIDLTKDKVTFQFNPYEYVVNERKKPFSLKLTNYGIMEKVDNWEYDYSCYMDIDYFRTLYKKYANTLNAEDRKKALSAIENYERIKITVAMFLEPMQETSNMLQMVLGGIGAIAMLVSAINIANTMIMSIYERTKEIGIMKVLGCVITDIKKLFLFEAGMIGLIGGIIGIGLSYLASFAINKFGQPLFQALLSTNYMYNMENTKFSIIPFWLPFVAAGFAFLVGVLSGYYPANRATKISAIEAMKTDS